MPKLTRKDLHGFAVTDGDAPTLRARLVAHYASTEGQAEIAAGPVWHRNRTPDEIADLLLKDIDWKAVAKARGGGGHGQG